MFGLYKKKEAALMQRMQNLNQVSRLVVGSVLVQEANSVAGLDELAYKRLAASVNFMFGESADPDHTERFGLDAIESESMAWLAEHDLLRELVVQSLRVENVVRYSRGERGHGVGESVLSAYGREFPNAPDPAAYTTLVEGCLSALPEVRQQNVNEWRARLKL